MTIPESPTSVAISIPVSGIVLAGDLAIPSASRGLVVFAHGSGSSRSSPRNRHLATALQARGLATLLLDLLTADEERIEAIDTTLHFDVDLLAERLIAATDWVIGEPVARANAIGYFGASTGAAAALIAAARRPEHVAAVVSRGGRPDLAGAELAAVRAPTLFIVGGLDRHVLELNRSAAARMAAPHELHVVPNATPLFEEAGTIDQVAQLAGDWFLRHLGARTEHATRTG